MAKKTTISVRNFDGDVRRRTVPVEPAKDHHNALVRLCNQGWDEYRSGTSGWRSLPSMPYSEGVK